MNSMCSACNSIPKIDSFRLKLQRRSDSRDDLNEADTRKTNFAYLPRDQLLLKLRETKEQLECCRSQVFLLSSALARVKQRAHSLKDKIKEFSRRGNISAIGYNIAKAYKEGKLKDKAGLVNILDTISQNLCKKKKGKRYSANSKDF